MDDSISKILVNPLLTSVAKVGEINLKMQEYGIAKLLGEGESELRDIEVGTLHIPTRLGEYGLTRKHQIEAMMILGKYTARDIHKELREGTHVTIKRAFDKFQNAFPTFSLEENSTNDDCDNIVNLTIYGTNKIPNYYTGLRQYIFNAGFTESPIVQPDSVECFTKCVKPVVEAEKKRRNESRVTAIKPMGWMCSCDQINGISETNCKNCHKPKPAFKHTKSIQKTKRSRKQSSKKRKSVKKNKSLKKIKPKEKMKI
jgi:hypothetical protein